MSTLQPDAVRRLVAAAASAPSMHNAQPWLFTFDSPGRSFELRADPQRSIPLADPDGRGLHLGCGAALFTLRVAAVHDGWAPSVMLLPDPDDPDLLATLRLAPAARRDPGLDRLYTAVARRHTSREPFADRRIPDDVREILVGAAQEEGAQLLFPDPWHRDEVLDLIEDAEERQRADPRVRKELASWTRIGPDARTSDDGVPEYAFGPRRWLGPAPVRDFADERTIAGRPTAEFEHSPQIALLGTHGDGRREWLSAGQALGRVLLEATDRGLATSLTSHALEWSALRWLVRDPLSALGNVQMVLRLGYGPTGPGTSRRPVDDILTVRT